MSVPPSVHPSVHPSVTHELKPCESAVFDQNYCWYEQERILCCVSGLVFKCSVILSLKRLKHDWFFWDVPSCYSEAPIANISSIGASSTEYRMRVLYYEVPDFILSRPLIQFHQKRRKKTWRMFSIDKDSDVICPRGTTFPNWTLF